MTQTLYMRSILITILLTLLLPGPTRAAQPNTAPATRPALIAAVDPRVELICIICRLAGYPEYSAGCIDSYNKDVDAHFLPFRSHPAIKMARQLRDNRSIGFDAPMCLAVHLTDAAALKELVPLDPPPADLDSRWRPDELRAFLEAARDFAQQSKFDDFYKAHKPLYEVAAARMDACMARYAHLEWFDQFFGPRSDANFHLVIGLLNGPSNYGARCATPTKTDLYCILGTWNRDNKGLPLFPKSVLPTVIHEFCHSYANPLIEKHLAALEPAGMKIFPKVQQIMKRQAYDNWRTMFIESLVRVCVVRYRHATEGGFAALSEIAEQHSRGFAWTGGLSKLLTDYEQHRDQYPTLDAFMPRIVTFFNDYAAK